MYESEVNNGVELTSNIPENTLVKFKEYKEKISHRSMLLWEEHCTECNFPVCYTLCELYDPRIDSKCRLFVGGSIIVDFKDGINPYLLSISFKRWGKIWTKSLTSNKINLYKTSTAFNIEKLNILAGRYLQKIAFNKLRVTLIKKFGSLKYHSQRIRVINEVIPSHLVVECYNPQSYKINASLTIKPNDTQKDNGNLNSCKVSPIFFQKLIRINPGYNLEKISFEEINSLVDFRMGFDIEFTPNNINDGTKLVFGLLDFVKEKPEHQKKKKLKCLVWDLDNTLWKGTLVEDGAERIQLNKGIKEILKELDSRGILLSIASKNNHDEVLDVLKKFEIIDYFLFPQISWNPKSHAIPNIAKKLNIGIDSIAFIDDQPFEREEIKSSLPDVTIINADKYLALLDMDEFNVPVTEESKKRRGMYSQQIVRDQYLESIGGDYFKFLKDCNIKIELKPIALENIERVFELAQRTNQMNFSGKRYQKDELQSFIDSNTFHSYVLSCEDKFGSYGIVGFCLINSEERRLIDLMFSCRVQSKRVEHAFLSHILKKYMSKTDEDFYANYTKTEKNKPSGKVFYDLGFEEISENNRITLLRFKHNQKILNENIIDILDLGLNK